MTRPRARPRTTAGPRAAVRTRTKAGRSAAAARAGLLALAAALLAAPAPAAGQAADDDPGRWSLALRAGFSSPRGDLADHSDDGLFVGLAAGYRDRGLPRVTLLAEVSLENMERGGGGQVAPDPLGPDIELWRVTGGVAVDLLEPGLSPWEITGRGVLGVTIVASSAFRGFGAFVGAEPTVGGGLAVGREIGDRLTAFGRADAYLFLDGVRPGEANFFGREATLTHTLGLRWRL